MLAEMAKVVETFTPQENISINGDGVIVENERFETITKIYTELNKRGFKPIVVSTETNSYYIY